MHQSSRLQRLLFRSRPNPSLGHQLRVPAPGPSSRPPRLGSGGRRTPRAPCCAPGEPPGPNLGTGGPGAGPTGASPNPNLVCKGRSSLTPRVSPSANSTPVLRSKQLFLQQRLIIIFFLKTELKDFHRHCHRLISSLSKREKKPTTNK